MPHPTMRRLESGAIVCVGLSICACMHGQYIFLGPQPAASALDKGRTLAFRPGFAGRSDGFGQWPEHMACPARFAQRHRSVSKCPRLSPPAVLLRHAVVPRSMHNASEVLQNAATSASGAVA